MNKKLFEQAKIAQKNSYSPYSHYPVGAALMDDQGRIYSGCNVENASFGGTICAERVAITKAISEGAKEIKELVVLTNERSPASPCGICRQFINEFAQKDLKIHCSNPNQSEVITYTLEQLLPHSFNGESVFGVKK